MQALEQYVKRYRAQPSAGFTTFRGTATARTQLKGASRAVEPIGAENE
jgi:hypothetical protein